MMEAIPMSCMQQFFSGGGPPNGTPRPGCRGIPNPHSNLAMKSLSPNYEHDLPELDELGGPSFYDINLFDNDRYSKMNFNGNTGSYVVFDNLSSTLSQPDCYNSNNNNSDQVTPTPTATDCTTVTAFHKSLNTLTNLDETWQGRHPSLWDHSQVTQWVHHVCERKKLDYECVRMGTYDWDGITGNTLLSMNKHEFQARFQYGGSQIYEVLQELRFCFANVDGENSFCNYETMFGWSAEMDNTFIVSPNNNTTVIGTARVPSSNLHDPLQTNHHHNHHHPHHQMQYATNRYSVKVETDSDVESNQSLSYVNGYHADHGNNQNLHDGSKLLRRKPGRPPNKEKKNKSKNGQRNSRLWEFIRDLLLDSKTCPSLLKWENVEEGIFRFVQSDRVARLWGERKCNPRMTYEKLSRAMRYYYKSQVFLPVIGRRLVYRFGPNATGWRPNPSLYS